MTPCQNLQPLLEKFAANRLRLVRFATRIVLALEICELSSEEMKMQLSNARSITLSDIREKFGHRHEITLGNANIMLASSSIIALFATLAVIAVVRVLDIKSEVSVLSVVEVESI